MVDRDIVARRLLALNEALAHLERQRPLDGERLLKDALLRAGVERWLQVAIEACIDIAYHVVAEHGWTPPDAARTAFATLASHGMLDTDLARRLGLAAGMRNFLVHAYAEVDVALIARAANDDLGDLRAFGAVAARLMDDAASPAR